MGTLLNGSAAAAGSPDWPVAATQLAHRVRWDLGGSAELRVLSLSEFCAEAMRGARNYGLILGVDLIKAPPQECEEAVREAVARSSARLFIASARDRRVGAFWRGLTHLRGAGADDLEDAGPFGLRAWLGGWTEAAKVRGDIVSLWQRRTAEEAVYATLVLIDAMLSPLTSMQEQRPVPTQESIGRAVDKCQDEFRACFTSPRCLQSLACIANCELADQSCSYNCIVSYSSDAFTQFSLCALQKHNLLNSQIKRPTTPQVTPIEAFRGMPLTHDIAEDILVGHFDPASGQRFGWLVAAGSNPAYEQFALQYQLWYRGSKGTFWYHPTFLVSALDGQEIWRTRDYRVRRKDVPGLWDFSVVDNGIVSEERWHLLGVDENLEWLVLFYVGAARRAGLAYRGCLVLTKDGSVPKGSAAADGIAAAVARAGMQPWELEATSNPPVDPANPPPLISPETQPAAPLLLATA